MTDYLYLHPEVLAIAYPLIINLALLYMMGVDKQRAKSGGQRIPETRLFLFALLGGSLGGIAGIYLFRHKTKHKSFTIGFPVILLLQLAALAAIMFI